MRGMEAVAQQISIMTAYVNCELWKKVKRGDGRNDLLLYVHIDINFNGKIHNEVPRYAKIIV